MGEYLGSPNVAAVDEKIKRDTPGASGPPTGFTHVEPNQPTIIWRAVEAL